MPSERVQESGVKKTGAHKAKVKMKDVKQQQNNKQEKLHTKSIYKKDGQNLFVPSFVPHFNLPDVQILLNLRSVEVIKLSVHIFFIDF